MENVKVSILLTSFNHERFIREAIESTLAQTFTDYELIIVDDCSTDSSWKIIQSYDDPRIIAIRHDCNKREPIYYNYHLCSGEYIAIHHSDDVWLPDKLGKQVEYLDAHLETAACFTLVQIVDEEGRDYANSGTPYDGIFDQANRSRFEWLHTFFYEGNKLCHPSILIRKEAYLEYGLFTHGLAQLPDFVQWIRLCRNAEIYIIQEKLMRFRLLNKGENTSGYRIPVIIRNSIEWHLLQNEYLSIPEKDFLKVFPEAARYKSPKGAVIEFILAQMCLTHRNPAVCLFGVELLYRLLNNPENAKKLEDFYSFTIIDFIKITDQNDIFQVTPKDRWLAVTLRLGFEDGALADISDKRFLQPDRSFTFEYDLSEYEGVSSIFFVAHADWISKFQIEGVLIDNREAVMTPLNGTYSVDGNDFFFVLNPTYRIEGIGRKLIINGLFFAASNIEIHNIIEKKNIIYTELLSSRIELQNSLTELQKIHTKLQSAHDELQKIHTKLQSAHDELQTVHDELQTAHDELLNSKSYKVMTKMRRIAKKIGILTLLRRLTT